MSIQPALADTLRLRVDCAKITNGELFAVKCDEGIGEWLIFERRKHNISSPVTSGRYYAFVDEGSKGHVVQLSTVEGDSFEPISVVSGDVYGGEQVNREEIESRLGDTVFLLERVDSGS